MRGKSPPSQTYFKEKPTVIIGNKHQGHFTEPVLYGRLNCQLGGPHWIIRASLLWRRAIRISRERPVTLATPLYEIKRAKMYWILICRSPGFAPFGPVWPKFRPKSDHPGLESCKCNSKAISMMLREITVFWKKIERIKLNNSLGFKEDFLIKGYHYLILLKLGI